jgi:hypothetical protein
MPFQEHQEFVAMFSDLPKSTCAACILQHADMRHRDALIEVFEQTAKRAQRFSEGICSICKAEKFVINPA